jgi:molybdenum cofactor cytidylyltransferase
MPKIGVIILAAGQSSRMGAQKQLLDFGGRPLIQHAAEVALASQCRPVVVVLGSSASRIAMVLEGLPVGIAVNTRWSEGMGTSIQTGLAALAGNDLDGVVLTLADQPLVTAEHLDGLIAKQAATGCSVVAAEYAGTVGIPVLFMSPMFSQLRALPPDQGCKAVILAHNASGAFMACPEAASDIDTPEDLAAISLVASKRTA